MQGRSTGTHSHVFTHFRHKVHALDEEAWFLDEMAGIHLKIEGMKSLSINARQLHFFTSKEYVPFPAIGKEMIDDKNKIDGFSRYLSPMQYVHADLPLFDRFIKLKQVSWLTLRTVSRPFKSLCYHDV